MTLRAWSAWAPGREAASAWRTWCEQPGPLAGDDRPGARFLPALLRRRCGGLARIMLTVAFDCCDEDERSRVATVFASRHGNINESIELLERLACDQPLSPTRFSHTVHNAQAGLFSIAAGNRHPSSSLAAQENTFGCGFLEALTLLERHPERPVLLVTADVPLADDFAPLCDENAACYGLALLLAAPGDAGTALRFGVATADAAAAHPDWPDALEFLRWLHGPQERLVLGAGPARFVWDRHPPLPAATRVSRS